MGKRKRSRSRSPELLHQHHRLRDSHQIAGAPPSHHRLRDSHIIASEILTRSPELPHHIIASEILTRLPVKSLSRFRCVSKRWCSLISDPHFQMDHLRRSQQSPLLLVAKSEKQDAASSILRLSTYTNDGASLLKDFFKIVTDNDIKHKATFEPVQSCLGLVCLRNIMDGAIHVFNPSTEDAIILPERPDQESDLCIGFGYTDSTREFKAFRIFNPDGLEDQDCGCEVFTLGDPNGWRSIRNPPYRPSLNTHLPLLHGALHFLPSLYYHEHERQHHYITAINVDTEDYTPIPLPDIYFGGEATTFMDECQLAELRGSLCLSFDFYHSKSLLQLWFMKDYRSREWEKGYNIDLSAKPLFFSPLAITLNGCILLSTRAATPEVWHELCYYDAHKNCVTRTIGKDCSAIFYIESFMSLRRSPRLEPV